MRKFLFILLSPLLLFAVSVNSEKPDAPWYTGPLLTPSAKVVPKGNFNIEPYVYWLVINGEYDSKSHARSIPHINQIQNQFTFKIGLTERVDLTGSFQSFYARMLGVHSTGFNDSSLGLEYQIHLAKPDEWYPNIKCSLVEILPTGRSEHLRLRKLGTDAGGTGAYLTLASLTLGKIIHLYDVHFLSLRLNFNATFKGRSRVKGLNTFGGDRTTSGRVFIGSTFIVQGAFELNLTRNWVLACDFQAFYSAKDTFRGRTLLPVGGPSNTLYSLAPAIEYNFSDPLGVIIGSWFTVNGRNAPRFVSLVAAVDYTY